MVSSLHDLDELLKQQFDITFDEIFLLVHYTSRYDQQFNALNIYGSGKIPVVPNYLAHIGWGQVFPSQALNPTLRQNGQFNSAYVKNELYQYVYGDGNGYAGFVYHDQDYRDGEGWVHQYVLVNPGTKPGGKGPLGLWDANGDLNWDWVTNIQAGTITGTQFKDLANQAADAFLRFMREFGSSEKVELFIAGESQSGLSNQIMLSLAHYFNQSKVGYLSATGEAIHYADITQAVGINTLHMTNALAEALTLHFQTLTSADLQRQPQLSELKRYVDAGKFDAGKFNDPDLRFKIQTSGNAYKNYTVFNKTNDLVGNMVAPIVGATTYFVAPKMTEAEYINEYYRTHPIEKIVDITGKIVSGSLFGVVSTYQSITLAGDYLVQNHIGESFIDYGSYRRVGAIEDADNGFYSNGNLPNLGNLYHSNTEIVSINKNYYTGPVPVLGISVDLLQSAVKGISQLKIPDTIMLNINPELLNHAFFIPDFVKVSYQDFLSAVEQQDIQLIGSNLEVFKLSLLSWDVKKDPYIQSVIELNKDSDAYVEGRISNNSFYLKPGEVIKLPSENNPAMVGGHLYFDSDESNLISGGTGNDVIVANGGNDTVIGGAGNEVYYGGSGNDVLTGGKGNDTLYGGEGNDTYYFSRGDGDDTIYDSSGNDTLKFGGGIKRSDITNTRRVGDDLIYSFRNGDQVTIKDYFTADGKIENIKFASESRSYDATVYGTENSDFWIYPTNTAVYGVDFFTDDILYGLGGNDDLIAGLGNDYLVGGKGNDDMAGIGGDDIYLWNRGDGHDRIDEGLIYRGDIVAQLKAA